MLISLTVISGELLLGFKDHPRTPANRAQEMKQKNQGESYIGSIKNLCTNPGYVLLLITYGMNVGVFYAISTLLNTTIVKHFDYEVSIFISFILDILASFSKFSVLNLSLFNLIIFLRVSDKITSAECDLQMKL